MKNVVIITTLAIVISSLTGCGTIIEDGVSTPALEQSIDNNFVGIEQSAELEENTEETTESIVEIEQINPSEIEVVAAYLTNKDESGLMKYLQDNYTEDIINTVWDIGIAVNTMLNNAGSDDFSDNFSDLSDEERKYFEENSQKIMEEFARIDVLTSDYLYAKVKEIAKDAKDFDSLSKDKQAEIILIMLNTIKPSMQKIQPMVKEYINEFTKRGIDVATEVAGSDIDEYYKEMTDELTLENIILSINDILSMDETENLKVENSTEETKDLTGLTEKGTLDKSALIGPNVVQ